MDDSTRTIVALAGDGSTDAARVAAAQNHRIDRPTADVSRLRARVSRAEDDVRQRLRHARSESRTYAKGIVGGASSITLTPEEQQALRSATQAEPRRASERPDHKREQKDAS